MGKGEKRALLEAIVVVLLTICICIVVYLMVSVPQIYTYYEGRFESCTVSVGGFGHNDVVTIVLENQTLMFSKYDNMSLSLEPGGYYNFTVHEGFLYSYQKIDK